MADTASPAPAPAADTGTETAAAPAAPTASFEEIEVNGTIVKVPKSEPEPVVEAEAKPEPEPSKEPNGRAFAALRKAQKASEQAAAKAAETQRQADERVKAAEAREAEVKTKIEFVEGFYKAIDSGDDAAIVRSLIELGLTTERLTLGLADVFSEQTPEKETSRRIAKLEADREAERRESEERAAAEKKQAEERAAADRKQVYEQTVGVVAGMAAELGFENVPATKTLARAAIAHVQRVWEQMGRPDVPESEYRDALKAAIPIVSEDFKAQGWALPKKNPSPSPAANQASPQSEANPAQVGRGESPKTISSSMTGASPILKGASPPPPGASRAEVLEWAIANASA